MYLDSLLTIFGTDNYHCILITSGQDGVCAAGKKGGGNYVMVKLGVQDKLDTGMSTVVV